MSMDLLARTSIVALRAGADGVNSGQDKLSNELAWLDGLCARLIQSDWDGEASEEFAASWADFRKVLGFHIEIADETGRALRELHTKLAPLQEEYRTIAGRVAAEGLSLDLQSGSVGMPELVTTPERAGQLAAETSDEIRLINLRMEDLLLEASAIERRAALAFENLLERLNNYEPELVALVKNLSSVLEAFNQGTGTIAGMAAGAQVGSMRASRAVRDRRADYRAARKTPNREAAKAALKGAIRANDSASDAVAQWGRYAKNPLVQVGTRGLKGVPAVGTILSVASSYSQNVAEGDSTEEAVTTAIVSGGVNAAAGLVTGAATTYGASFLVSAGLATGPVGWVALGVAAGTMYFAAPTIQKIGDELGQELHDHIVSPIAESVSYGWERLFS